MPSSTATANKIPQALRPGSIVERFLQVDQRGIDADARTVEVAFSSEAPVDRHYGIEVLDHSPGSMRTHRLDSGAAVLVDHDPRDQVGVVASARTGDDRVGRAALRFGRSARASEIFQDVQDGIRPNVSVRYLVHEAVHEVREGRDAYRITDWEPFEISIVSIPADPSVGVGRSHSATKETAIMPNETATPAAAAPAAAPAPAATAPATPAAPVDTTAARSAGADGERRRSADIIAIGQQYRHLGADAMVNDAISNGLTVDAFRSQVLEHAGRQPVPSAAIGMSENEVRQYSFVRALAALANPTDQRARERAAYEFEVSEAAAERAGRESRGLVVPFDVLRAQARGLEVGTATAGGHTVATDLLSSSFIDLLRDAMIINTLGAQYLTGLVGNVAIPKQTGGATMYWVDENGIPTESQQAFGQVPMSPKTAAARTEISRKLLLQSSIDVEAFVRRDLATTIGLGIQAAAINGSGSGAEPRGILNTTGIGSVTADGWDGVVDLETAVAVANADVGTLAYLTNAKVRGLLKKTFVDGPGTGERVWASGNTPLNGYRAGVTNAVPSNLATDNSALIFGNWADLIIGMWGGLDLQVDPFSAGDKGAVVVRVFQDVDVAVRHGESFAAKLNVAA